MKTIGLLGGMSWESTVTYYRIINETVKKQLGGLHSAKCLLCSVDFAELERYQANGEWDKIAAVLTDAALRLEKAGADFIAICTNTMHKVAPRIQAEISIPILHIAEAAAEELLRNNITSAALLGTKYTMTQDFYKAKLAESGIDVLIPDGPDIETVNAVIYRELCLGVISERSRAELVRIVGQLAQRGARGVILGCTEIGLLLRQSDVDVPLFDTTVIHATKAALLSLR